MSIYTKVALVGAAAVAGMAVLFNLPNNPFVKAPQRATLEYLAQAKLRTFGFPPREFLVI